MSIEDPGLTGGISRDARLRAEPSQPPPQPLSGAPGRPHMTGPGSEGQRGHSRLVAERHRSAQGERKPTGRTAVGAQDHVLSWLCDRGM